MTQVFFFFTREMTEINVRLLVNKYDLSVSRQTFSNFEFSISLNTGNGEIELTDEFLLNEWLLPLQDQQIISVSQKPETFSHNRRPGEPT